MWIWTGQLVKNRVCLIGFTVLARGISGPKTEEWASWGKSANTFAPEFSLSWVSCRDTAWITFGKGTEHGCNHSVVICHTLMIHGVPDMSKTYRPDYYYYYYVKTWLSIWEALNMSFHEGFWVLMLYKVSIHGRHRPCWGTYTNEV